MHEVAQVAKEEQTLRVYDGLCTGYVDMGTTGKPMVESTEIEEHRWKYTRNATCLN